MNVIVYHGNGSSRALLREREFWHDEPFVTKDQSKKLRQAGRVKFHILITTYEVALKVRFLLFCFACVWGLGGGRGGYPFHP